MKVYIASDHAGFALKAALGTYVRSLGHEVTDMGAATLVEDDDYPELITPCARAVVEAQVQNTEDDRVAGIVIGGSGNGEAMAANRVAGARAAVYYGHDERIVRLAREHNDANILSLGARFVSEDEACEAVRIFLTTAFSGDPRHARRIQELG